MKAFQQKFILTRLIIKEIKGWMIIGQKGLARVEFEPPNHLIMVADGNWLIVHDAQYDRTSYLPLESGILGLLLNQKISQAINYQLPKIKIIILFNNFLKILKARNSESFNKVI